MRARREFPRNVGGRELRFRWIDPPAGDDPTEGVAVFLHDGLGAIESWKKVPERICSETGRAALLYDRWGHGGSEFRSRFEAGFMEAEVPVLREIIEAFELGSVRPGRTFRRRQHRPALRRGPSRPGESRRERRRAHVRGTVDARARSRRNPLRSPGYPALSAVSSSAGSSSLSTTQPSKRLMMRSP